MTEEVNFLKTKHKSKEKVKSEDRSQPSQEIQCKFCSKKHFPKKSSCPAWGRRCTKCGRSNDFSGSIKCKQKSKSKRHTAHVIDSDSSAPSASESDSEDDEALCLTDEVCSLASDRTNANFRNKILAMMQL